MMQAYVQKATHSLTNAPHGAPQDDEANAHIETRPDKRATWGTTGMSNYRHEQRQVTYTS